jgi:hypothetical protein
MVGSIWLKADPSGWVPWPQQSTFEIRKYSEPFNPSRHVLYTGDCTQFLRLLFCMQVSMLAVPPLRRLVAGFPQRRPRSGHVGFVVDKVALGKVFSEYFCFPCQFSFHRLLHNHQHHLSSGAGTIGQTVAAVPSGPSLTQRSTRREIIIKKKLYRTSSVRIKRTVHAILVPKQHKCYE